MVTVSEVDDDMVTRNLNTHVDQRRISMLKLLLFMLLVTFYNH